ncbi:MAG: hypothetical protein NZ805_06860 [Armatimonadetes bacterium]|nr:hypothetical protein [Armatimonadota bacterium]MDW8028433.1 hypothetical protein [Armatimonadota bacterium]
MGAQDHDSCFPPNRNWLIQAWGDGITLPKLLELKGCGWGNEG